MLGSPSPQMQAIFETGVIRSFILSKKLMGVGIYILASGPKEKVRLARKSYFVYIYSKSGVSNLLAYTGHI